MKKLFSLFLGVGSVAIGAAAWAGEPYIGAGWGDYKAAVDTGAYSVGTDKKTDKPFFWKFLMGHNFVPYVGIEADYRWMRDTNVSVGDGTNGAAIAWAANMYSAGLTLTTPTIDWPVKDAFALYAKGGAAHWQIDSSCTATGTTVCNPGSSAHVSGNSPMAGVGLKFQQQSSVLRLSYEVVRQVGDKNITGRERMSFLSLDLIYAFK